MLSPEEDETVSLQAASELNGKLSHITRTESIRKTSVTAFTLTPLCTGQLLIERPQTAPFRCFLFCGVGACTGQLISQGSGHKATI